MSLQNENELEDKIFDETIDPIVDPIYDIICKSSIRGIMSNVKQLVDISPVKFKFGFKFYNYYDVIFEYENEKITWKAISCKKGEEEITNNKLYNPMESQEIVHDIDNILKLTIPQKYLQTLNGNNYETFEKRLDYITVSSKEELNELKRAEKNDNFKTTDECLDFMIEEVKKAFGSDAENFKIIDNYDYHGQHINFTFEAYKTFTVKIIHELEDGAQIVIGSDEQIKKGDMEHYFNIPMSANGVFLPYQKNEFVTTEAMHCGGHLDSYHINVRKRLEDLIDKAEDLRYSNILIQKLICNELQTIRKELLSGFLKIHN